MARPAEYSVWVDMKRRCTDPRRDSYPLYGGRGISVCQRWQCFANFFADMGPRPTPKHTIDRIDGKGNYEPENCRWATQIEQQNNKSSNRRVLYRGSTTTLRQAIRMAGDIVGRDTARRRIVDWGWPIDRAVETPPALQGRDPLTFRRADRKGA